MVFALRTYDTSTFEGQLACISDMLAMPADNLVINLSSLQPELTRLNLSFARELAAEQLTDERRRQLSAQLEMVNRAFQMILEAASLLQASKSVGQELVPNKAANELPPAPPIVRQTQRPAERQS